MAKKKKAKETTDAGTLGRLSKAGEDAVTRLFDELGKNERVTDALGKAMSAKGKVDESAKKALGQVGLAAADELKDLRKHIERLEKRLAKLESEAKPRRSRGRPRGRRSRRTTSVSPSAGGRRRHGPRSKAPEEPGATPAA